MSSSQKISVTKCDKDFVIEYVARRKKYVSNIIQITIVTKKLLIYDKIYRTFD